MGKIKGIIPAIITPFDYSGNLYFKGFLNQLKYLKKYGFKCIFALGSYGSFPVMTIQQRKIATELVVKLCKKYEMKSIVHIGSPSTEISIELAKYAEDVGADMISSVVPFYYSSTFYSEDIILDYYKAIIDSVSIDVHCYNNLKTTGFSVTPEFLGKLIDVGVRGIKDGGPYLLGMLDAVRKSPYTYEFEYYPSSTKFLLDGFLLGADACISGIALSVPHLIQRFYEHIRHGNYPTSAYYFMKIMQVRDIIGAKGGRAITAYDILHRKGVDVGTCKAPWKRLKEEDREWVFQQLDKIVESEDQDGIPSKPEYRHSEK